MTNAKTGLVVVASQYESGGQRAQELAALAKASLEQREITVAEGAKVVWDAADAIDVCKELRKTRDRFPHDYSEHLGDGLPAVCVGT